MDVGIDFEKTVVTLPGGRSVTYATPTSLALIAAEPEMQPRADTGPLLAIRVNGLVTSLNKKLIAHEDVAVEPVWFESAEGRSTYRRSLVFIMTMAASLELPNRHIVVDHSATTGYVVTVDHGEPVAKEEVARIKARMAEIVASDSPITERVIGYAEALRYFESRNRPYARALIDTSSSDKIRVFNCQGHLAPYARALVPRTGMLNTYDLLPLSTGRGFAMMFPGMYPGMPLAVVPGGVFEEKEALADVYREHHEWQRLLGAECVGHVNQHIVANEAKEFVFMSEALHNQKIVEIALQMAKSRDRLRIVLIAGPSASGKTTFAAKLSMQLRIMGFCPTVLSVDNYYRPRVECPKDENGDYDFETVDALRLDTLNDHLVRLLAGEEVETPIFDFYTGLPKKTGIKMRLPKNGLLVMEGINTLNDKLTSAVPASAKFRIFLAPLSQLNIDECNFPSHSVDRLIRRINRDYNHRGYSARDTLARWPAVTRSENRNIMPFAKFADVVFNTTLIYEKCVLKTFVSPLLKSVKPGSPQYNDARNIIEMLDNFFPISHELVPNNSLLREFIGGSCFEE